MELHFDQPSGGDIPACNIDQNWRGDGLLVYRHSVAEAKAWKKAGIAVVNLSSEIPRHPVDFPRITVDNKMVGQVGYEHLAALGLRDFAYMHESTRIYSDLLGSTRIYSDLLGSTRIYSDLRLKSFREMVLKNGGRFHQIEVPASDFPEETRPQDIDRCLHDQLLALPRPYGMLVKDDIAGVWTTRLLRRLKIRCPEDIPILGVSNDIVFCHTCQPPLSSIPYPGRKIGFAAAELLDNMMKAKSIPDDYWRVLPPDPLVARESTYQVILSDKLVTRALRVIRQEAPFRLVSVGELSKALGISSEGLRLRFVKVLGHGPKVEIDRLRCQIVTERLRKSEDTLEAIAHHHGFAGATELCRMIKRSTGKTPGQIRRENRQ